MLLISAPVFVLNIWLGYGQESVAHFILCIGGTVGYGQESVAYLNLLCNLIM